LASASFSPLCLSPPYNPGGNKTKKIVLKKEGIEMGD
jgi:hypothetical protein